MKHRYLGVLHLSQRREYEILRRTSCALNPLLAIAVGAAIASFLIGWLLL